VTGSWLSLIKSVSSSISSEIGYEYDCTYDGRLLHETIFIEPRGQNGLDGHTPHSIDGLSLSSAELFVYGGHTLREPRQNLVF
jgi:hypothetical protein